MAPLGERQRAPSDARNFRTLDRRVPRYVQGVARQTERQALRRRRRLTGRGARLPRLPVR